LPSGRYFNGSLDDIRIYNRALSASEVAVLYNGGAGRTDNPSSGIVGWWKMNDGSGQTVTDSSGSGNNGTLGASSSVASDDPTWSTGSPVKLSSGLWIGTSDGSGGGAVTDISLNTDRYVTSFSTANSSLASNNISSLAVGSGGLAIVGTSDAGAWPAALAGFTVDDTAVTAASSNQAIRITGGTVRFEGGTVRLGGQ